MQATYNYYIRVTNFVGCTDHRSNIKPKAESGVMDLTQIQLKNDVVSMMRMEFFESTLAPDEVEAGVKRLCSNSKFVNKYANNKEHSDMVTQLMTGVYYKGKC